MSSIPSFQLPIHFTLLFNWKWGKPQWHFPKFWKNTGNTDHKRLLTGHQSTKGFWLWLIITNRLLLSHWHSIEGQSSQPIKLSTFIMLNNSLFLRLYSILLVPRSFTLVLLNQCPICFSLKTVKFQAQTQVSPSITWQDNSNYWLITINEDNSTQWKWQHLTH